MTGGDPPVENAPVEQEDDGKLVDDAEEADKVTKVDWTTYKRVITSTGGIAVWTLSISLKMVQLYLDYTNGSKYA